MKISEEGISLIKKFEGCELSAYKDAVGIPTIAYGRIKNVGMGDSCTKEQAEDWLAEEMPEYEGYINDQVNVDLTQNQFDALCSWVYNLGPSNLKKSTLLKVLNKEEYEDVPEQIIRWNKAGGKVLEGLTRRREAEALLFENKEWNGV
jgi:lysozyme